ncbi:LYR motif-containing protein 4 isoform X1 [Parus major]|uniref:LYR motif-containing protein 4 isoform X1 n=1 Tax=Parus major TaxID=9157 RepID=UPI0007710B9D|nr:LYR motif-containing protein 4 isoform X1 [Parus major]
MAASSRAQVLRLYRALLRESQRFSGYNYRTYAIRRIRDAFRENKNIADSEKIEELLNKAKANLEIIQRQGWAEEHWEGNPFVFGTGRVCAVPLKSSVMAGHPPQRGQVTIDQLYSTEKLVIESPGNT